MCLNIGNRFLQEHSKSKSSCQSMTHVLRSTVNDIQSKRLTFLCLGNTGYTG